MPTFSEYQYKRKKLIKDYMSVCSCSQCVHLVGIISDKCWSKMIFFIVFTAKYILMIIAMHSYIFYKNSWLLTTGLLE